MAQKNEFDMLGKFEAMPQRKAIAEALTTLYIVERDGEAVYYQTVSYMLNQCGKWRRSEHMEVYEVVKRRLKLARYYRTIGYDVIPKEDVTLFEFHPDRPRILLTHEDMTLIHTGVASAQ